MKPPAMAMRTSPTRWKFRSRRAIWRRPLWRPLRQRPRRQHPRPRWTMMSCWAPGAPYSDLRLPCSGAGLPGLRTSRGSGPPVYPRPSGWGIGWAPRVRLTRPARFPCPSPGRRAGPTCTVESYGFKHRPATELRRRLTRGSCFGTSTRHLPGMQRNCCNEASRHQDSPPPAEWARPTSLHSGSAIV